METMTEKTDQQSSVAELQEKIGIFLTYFFYINGLASLHNCPVFPQIKEDGEVDNAASYNIPSTGDLKC